MNNFMNYQNFYNKIFTLFFLFIISCNNSKNDKNNLMGLTALVLSSSSKGSEEKETKKKGVKKEQEIELKIEDSLYKEQWHLKNTKYTNQLTLNNGGKTKIDINIEPVWKQGYLGKGMKIGIFDGSIQYNHPDLKDNLPLQNYFNPYPDEPYCTKNGSDTHGTRVAGIIASQDNKIGTRGVAPRATLYGYVVVRSMLQLSPAQRRLKHDDNHHIEQMLKALQRSETREIAVYNGSLGDYGEDGSYNTNSTETALLQAFDTVTQDGFYGKGSSLVFSAGNKASLFDSAVNNHFLNHYAVISVNSIFPNGEIIPAEGNFIPLQQPGEIGSNIWLVAPTGDSFNYGSLMTTDLTGDCGGPGDWNARFGATSGAAPSVTGVIALLREAVPELSWRDVKLILAESAKKITPTNPIKQGTWKNTGKMFSNPTQKQEYHRVMGFGLVDAGAALKLAKNWTLLPSMKTETFEQTTSLDTQRLDVLHTSSLNVENSQINFIESVQLDLEIDRTTDLKLSKWTLSLVAPDGKIAKIYGRLDSFYESVKVADGLTKFRFLANAFLGNSVVNGTWKLEIQQQSSEQQTEHIQAIKNWKLTVRGH